MGADLNEKALGVFKRYATYIQNYIYKNGWSQLRLSQIEAGDVVFNTESNLVLLSSTASGKTEAALFPVLSILEMQPSSTISVLYIAPTKALINDQFDRLSDLLLESSVPVTKWHGDASVNAKNKLLNNPQGILQITPESLESILVNRSSDIIRLFGDLRFVIFDEIHTMMGSDRGCQVKCCIERIAQKIGYCPRIIALSATMGRAELAADWIGRGTGRDTAVVDIPSDDVHWRLLCEHFFVDTDSKNGIDAGYEFVHSSCYNKRAIVFSNSREETELVCATMHQICKKKGTEDRFYIHHGNLSAAIREDTERAIKDEDKKAVACATVTLELGVDIGKLERIVNVESPNTVSGFLQRLGRSGRRDASPEMVAVFRETTPLPYAPFYELLPWHLLQMIAIIQLYLESRFIEPLYEKKFPLSLMLHQTLSILASSGELTPASLAKKVLSLSAFSHVPREVYKELLIGLIKNGIIEQTDEKTLIVGVKGETITNNFKFYAVFQDSEDYSVKCASEEIGTISSPVPVGERFALAGRVWEVKELDISHRLIYVERVEGKMEISWPGAAGVIHTRILERIRQILCENKDYRYLSSKAAERIEAARNIARNSGMLTRPILCVGGVNYVIFPWLGTVGVRTLKKVLRTRCSEAFGISSVSSESCYYITFKMEKGTPDTLLDYLCRLFSNETIDPESYVDSNDLVAFEKYDKYIPQNLLNKAFAHDRLDFVEVGQRCRSKFKNE
ncbi:MAG: DEAD/DEAH box helicase [Clostridia bacterium]|nr:DEAD/DEAH box helicase [Clostridia bacterium]